MLINLIGVLTGLALLLPSLCLSKIQLSSKERENCDFSSLPGVVFWTSEREITIGKLAAYCAPVFWFSPDEPLMNNKSGKNLRIPQALPFEQTPNSPVVYYQYNQILVREDAEGPGYLPDETDKNHSLIDLHNVSGFKLKFIAYFSHDVGLGGHPHDVEPTALKLFVARSTELTEEFPEIQCDDLHYVVMLSRVTAESHGLEWFYNVLVVDEFTRFSIHLLVEEGKHGMCTDKNNDGYYTPGYDVNRRVNDAWGVRDILSQGALFSGSYQAWMTKVRRKEHRVFPPLPEDSPLREQYVSNGEYAAENAIYELRPYPSSQLAGNDALLNEKMAEKEEPNWPVVVENTDLKKFEDWLAEGLALKSFAISLFTDGNLGLSFVFPFFIFRNFEEPMAHGFLVHRIYLSDKSLRDIGWMILYTPSASRWLDNYFAAGAEWNKVDIGEGNTRTQLDFALETGIKFRLNITKSPLKFLGFFSPFWGFRAGIKNKGFFDIDQLTYVLEFGAGVW